MNNEEKILILLESLQQQISSLEKTTNKKFEAMEKSTNKRFDTMESRFENMECKFDTMDNRLDDMEKSTNKRFDALEKLVARENEITRAELKSEMENVYHEVKDLKDNLNSVEQVTAKNWLEITRLKSVK